MLVLDAGVTTGKPVRPWSRSHAVGDALLGQVGGTLEGADGDVTVVISRFEVLPEARGQGVGKALLAEVTVLAEKEKAVRVLIVTDCPIERMFFIRNGYTAREGGVAGLQTKKHYAVEMLLEEGNTAS